MSRLRLIGEAVLGLAFTACAAGCLFLIAVMVAPV